MPGVKFLFWKKAAPLPEDESEPLADEALTEKMQTGTLPTEGGAGRRTEKEILTTGEDGTLTVEKLVPGTYCIQEAEYGSGISDG